MIYMIVTLTLLVPPNQFVIPHVPVFAVAGQAYSTKLRCDQDRLRVAQAVTDAIARTRGVTAECRALEAKP